jgi:hypothetical protein
MNSQDSKKASLKQNITHQFKEFATIFVFLAFCFCAISTYRMLLLNEFRVLHFDYGAALINALVIGKVILLGEDAHLGKKHEAKPLFFSALYKAFLFGLLVFGFHIVEEVIKRLVHGHTLARAFHDIRIDDVLARCVVVFCTFIPLFGFMELRRALGEDKFHELLFRRGAIAQAKER